MGASSAAAASRTVSICACSARRPATRLPQRRSVCAQTTTVALASGRSAAPEPPAEGCADTGTETGTETGADPARGAVAAAGACGAERAVGAAPEVLVRRRGRLYVLNKKNPRLKARQG